MEEVEAQNSMAEEHLGGFKNISIKWGSSTIDIEIQPAGFLVEGSMRPAQILFISSLLESIALKIEQRRQNKKVMRLGE